MDPTLYGGTGLRRFVPGAVRRALRWAVDCCRWDRYQQVGYSQEGEDQVLKRIFGAQQSGFYVDVGAHHPQRFSNTYLFYRRGWRGINIDAMPGSMAAFNRCRQRDINLELPVLRERAAMKYFQFNEPALNGFSPTLTEARDGKGGYKVVNVVELEGLPLRDILARNLPAEIREIDFLSVDVEGLDFDVIQSNDWDRFRPKLVLVELIGSTLDRVAEDPIYRFLHDRGYRIYAKTAQTVFFMSEEYRTAMDASRSRAS
jgi:hypothetical protein